MRAYYLIGGAPLPNQLSDEVREAIAELQQYKDKERYLRQAYDLITHRYSSGRVKTFSRLQDILASSAEDLWNRSGFMHCTNQNYLLKLLLVGGGLFSEADITAKWTTVWLWSPHQYLAVRLSSTKTVNVDCWGRHYGIPFGMYAHGFNSTRKPFFAK